MGLERMLRSCLLQQWFNLSDPAVEESLCDSASMRQFVGIDLGREAAPDAYFVANLRIAPNAPKPAASSLNVAQITAATRNLSPRCA